jgi:single-strand DNA-binding protein
MNKVMLLGNLGANPEFHGDVDGTKFYTFPIATSDVWKDSTGVKQQKTTWHKVVVFKESAFNIAQLYLQKGSKVLVEGKLTYSKYVNDMGQNMVSTDIKIGSSGSLIFLDNPHSGDPIYNT